DVVEDHRIEGVEHGELLFEPEVALGREQALHQGVRGREQHPVAALDELMADGADDVCLAAAWQAEGEQILAPLDEAPLAESRRLLLHLGGDLGAIEGGERLLARQLGELLMARDTAATALLDFELGEMVQVLAEGP